MGEYDETKLNEARERDRIRMAGERGLPKDATWKDIAQSIDPLTIEERRRLERDRYERLIESPREREDRQETAEELGLPKDTSWGVITSKFAEEARRKQAEDFGLSPDATWDQIREARKSSPKP